MAPPPTSRRGPQPPTSRRGSPPEPPFLRTADEVLEEIFIRLPTAADLARVSTASASFRRVIADHAFLRRCHALHSPPLIGMIAGHFIPAQPPHPSAVASFFIVEAEDGALGRLAKWYYDYGFFAGDFDEDSGDSYLLTYSVLRNNQWHSEEIIPLPAKRAIVIGVAGGYLLIKALYTNSSQEELFGYFTVDVKTLQVELFAGLSEAISPSQLYVGFPPSLCPPTI